MFTRILSPLSAEPNLSLARARARRTPLARLSICYQIKPEPDCFRLAAGAGCGCGAAARAPQGRATQYTEFLAGSWPHAQLQLTRSLGASLYLDRILSGGVNGEFLPVTLDRCVEIELAAHAPGAVLDLQA